jgi:hypothetical protein
MKRRHDIKEMEFMLKIQRKLTNSTLKIPRK